MCLEPTKHKLECNHFNCIDCLKRLIKKSDLCPICRREFNIQPYKYNPPKHTPNLKLNKTTIKFLNEFLNCRYLLKKAICVLFVEENSTYTHINIILPNILLI